MSSEVIAETALRFAAALEAARDDENALVIAVRLNGELRRMVDGAGIELASRLVAASDPFREKPLTRVLGEKTPEMILQAYAGLDPADAFAWCRVGSALTPEVSLAGEVLPSSHEQLADALAEGRIRVSCASRLLETLDDIEPHSTLDERLAAEALLIETAPEVSDRGFTRACTELASKFVPDRAEERDEMLRRRAGVEFRTTRDGRRQMVVDLHPEAEGFLKASLDAKTAPRRQVALVDADGEQVEVDRRPIRQKRLDALVGIHRASLGSDPGRVAGTSVTMHVTIALDALQSGRGTAKISGVDAPIPASVARRLAADAEIIPVVLGGPSEPLDLGRSERLATTAQRTALGIKYGGCGWAMCDVPPEWCEVAHIVAWANGGTTDLDNLMLLCPFHHRCFDNDGWELQTIDGAQYLIPPAWVDSARTPRPFGRRTSIAA